VEDRASFSTDEGPAAGAHLLVRAGGAAFAMPAGAALEIWDVERCHPVPGTPRYVLGIASWRGTPLPLVDLAAALDLHPDGARSRGARDADGRRAVVVSIAAYLVGLVVDATLGVVEVPPGQARRPAIIVTGRVPEFSIAEIDAGRDGVAAVLDLVAFLDAARVRP
jgi:purine-binding chemotaxis protein CheW